LDALADGRLVRDPKLATELLAFAGHLKSKLAIETTRKSAAGKDTEGGDGNEVNPVAPQGSTANTYALHYEMRWQRALDTDDLCILKARGAFPASRARHHFTENCTSVR
jgi:hypothetical protein